MSSGKGRATDHVFHVLGDDFFIAYPILFVGIYSATPGKMISSITSALVAFPSR